MHTNVYAVYARGCSSSVTCQVAMVIELGSGSSNYTKGTWRCSSQWLSSGFTLSTHLLRLHARVNPS